VQQKLWLNKIISDLCRFCCWWKGFLPGGLTYYCSLIFIFITFTHQFNCKFEYSIVQGDSGGPLVVKRSSTDATIAGVVSFGRGCARPSNISEHFPH
jgi:hypothetical protein